MTKRGTNDWRSQARFLRTDGDWQASAVELDPASADAHDMLASFSPDLAGAATEHAAALALDPHSARAHYNLGVTLHGRGQTPAAEGEYRAALALQPGLLYALENLGTLLLARPERRAEGVALLAAALARETSPQIRQRLRKLLAGDRASSGMTPSTASPRPAEGDRDTVHSWRPAVR